MQQPNLLLVAVLSLGQAGFAGAALGQETAIQTFTVPHSINLVEPRYPVSQITSGGEGLVLVNFMVDTDGQAFDPVIVESTGDEVFHQAAINALLDSEFEPAKLEGEPIVGSHSLLVRFELETDAPGATNEFASAYRYFQRALREEEPEREKIETAFSRLEQFGARNHYEHAYLNLARYSYAQLYGTDLEQIRHLRRALSLSTSPRDPVYLDDEIIWELRRALFPLQVENNYFAEALETHELMVESGDEAGAASFQPVVDAVNALRQDDTEYFVPLTLDDAGSTSLQLFKSSFALIDGEGDLNEIKLRCEREYVAFQVERDVAYSLPDDAGDCSIEIIGDAGADFFLLQQ